MSRTQQLIKIVAIMVAIFLIVNICSGVLYLLSWFSYWSDDITEETVTFDQVYSDITELEIEGLSAEIMITVGEEFRVKALGMKGLLGVVSKGGKLEIEEQMKLFVPKSIGGKMVITVPRDLVLEQVAIETGAGKFTIKDIAVVDFELDHGAGVLELENVTFDKTDIDGGAGLIKISSSVLGKLELDAGVGEVVLEASVGDQSKISCGIGEVKVTLLGESADYRIKTEKGIGQIKIAGVNQENGVVYGTGNIDLEVEGGIGNLDISFE